jgi:hypothetical protein
MTNIACLAYWCQLQVFAPSGLASEAKRFLTPFAVDSVISAIDTIQTASLLGDRCLIYLSGREDEAQLATPLKRSARAKPRLQTVVLYARTADRRHYASCSPYPERSVPKVCL